MVVDKSKVSPRERSASSYIMFSFYVLWKGFSSSLHLYILILLTFNNLPCFYFCTAIHFDRFKATMPEKSLLEYVFNKNIVVNIIDTASYSRTAK